MIKLTAIGVIGSLLWANTAFGFGSVNIFGQGYEHQKITLLALKDQGFDPKSLRELAGSASTLGAVGAPDRPDRGFALAYWVHCDNGDYLPLPNYPQTKQQAQKKLEECRSFIFKHLNLAIAKSQRLLDDKADIIRKELSINKPCAFDGKPASVKCEVLESIGLAFHAAQDFYAHSNWSDVTISHENSASHPIGLANHTPADWLNPRLNATFPKGLVSGCFLGLPETNCSYANQLPRIRHFILNKDIGTIYPITGFVGKGATPRGKSNDNFKRAVQNAILDTRDKWIFFETQIMQAYGEINGKRILCALKRDNIGRCD